MGKNLANCTPMEFATQTVLIKHHVEKWLTATDIMNIRKTLPDLPDGLDEEEKRKRLEKQSRENLSRIFDAVMEEHPKETVELLCLLCFVPVSEIENYPMTFFMESISELLDNQVVWNFFTSLLAVGQRLGITQA